MIVDTHCHLYPERWRPEGRMPPDMFAVDQLVEELETAGVDCAVVSDPHIWYGDADMNELSRCKEYNEFAAGLAVSYPGRLVALGSTVPWRGAGHVNEARRAVSELGLSGLAVATSDGGQMLDGIGEEFWELVTELDVPLFLHPGGSTVGQEHMGDHRLGELCGRPLDMTVTLARAIMTGLLERHPTLRLLCAHAGGAICMIANRLDFGHELRDYAALGPWSGHRLADPPSAYVRRLFLDTVTYGPEPLRLAVRTVGARQVCFGTDHPPVPFPIQRSLDIVSALDLDAVDLDHVLGGNAAALLGLGGGEGPARDQTIRLGGQTGLEGGI